MLLKETPSKPPARRFTLADQARALAVVLQEEFGAPFLFYHAGTGEPLGSVYPEAGPLLTAEAVAQLAADGKPRVAVLDDGRYQLALLLSEAGRPVLAASGCLPALAAGAGAAREQARLLKWAQSFGDRLRLADQLQGHRQQEDDHQSQAARAWEALLTLDHLLHRVRIHREPQRNQRRILEAAHGLLAVQALAWVPYPADSPVLVHGEPCLAEADWRGLASGLAADLNGRPDEPFLCNDAPAAAWGARFPSLTSVLAFALTDQGPAGWVVAVNKAGGRPFRKSDAATLTPFATLLGLHARTAERYQDLKDLLVGLTRSLTAALDAKDSYTYGHSERVARIAVELGRELGLQGDELCDVYLTGLLHDVGKIGVRDGVLTKQGPLTPEEFEHVKQHVVIGYAILADLRPIRNLLPGVLYHHERVDGSGYPDGLVGDAIPLLARILSVADAYDAMSTTRPYREAMPCRRVEEVLAQGAGTQWDRQVVEAFQRCRLKIHAIRQRGVGDSLRQAIDGALRKDDSSLSWRPTV